MYCKHCGKEIADNVKFCNYCGAKVSQKNTEQREILQKETEQKAVEQITNTFVRNKKLAAILSGAGVLAVIVFVALMLFLKSGGEAEMADTGKEEKDILYPVMTKKTDIFLTDKTPGERNINAEWDGTVFYTLEDVSSDASDGQIAKYDVSYRRFYDTRKDCLLFLEIYTNPQTGVIGKIVAIFETGNILDLYDCYYEEDGTLNFIYHRTDSVYTPSYATIGRVGEWFYFNNDAMVKWRHVDEPNAVIDDVLSIIGESEYTRREYNTMDSVTKSVYGTTEVKMLSAGYHIYEAANRAEQYGVLKGYVKNEDGTPAREVKVTFYANDGGYKIGTVSTDINGYYETGITYDEAGYRIEISKKGKRTVTFYDIVPPMENDVMELAEVCLIEKEGKSCSVAVSVFDEGSYVYDDAGNLGVTGLANANVIVREGLYRYTGDTVFEGASDEQGKLDISLPAGMYTLEVQTGEGYPSYQTITVKGAEDVKIPVVKGLSGNEMKIVLTWDGNFDLDASLFTPYKAENGDMAYINSMNSEDSYGNRLMADSKNGNVSETIYIADKTSGTFKYYVSDYSNCISGNAAADDMQNMSIRVQIYDADGLVGVYTIPSGKGVVWEVVTIQNGKINPVQKCYANIDGKTWWLTDKATYLAEEDTRLEQVLSEQNGNNGYLRGLLEEICYFYFFVRDVEYDLTNDYIATESVQESINHLCDGDVTELAYFNGWDRVDSWSPYWAHKPVADLSYEEKERLWEAFRPGMYGTVYTREQINRIASSISGKIIDMDMNALSSDGEYVFCGTDLMEVGNSVYLESISTVRMGNGRWEVSAEVWHINYDLIKMKVADITFTVISNPESIYDGYSLAGAKVNITDNSSWKRDYYNYLTTNAEFKQWMSDSQNLGYEKKWSYIYVDEDAVPELYIEGNCFADGALLLTWYDGTVSSEIVSAYGDDYVERKGLFVDSGTRMGGHWDKVYELRKGKITLIGEGGFGEVVDAQGMPLYDEFGNIMLDFDWNDETVSLEQYDILLTEALGGNETISCYWYGGLPYYELLRYLSR